MWDTAGAEILRELAKMFTRDASMVLICFDLTNGESFNGVEYWVDSL